MRDTSPLHRTDKILTGRAPCPLARRVNIFSLKKTKYLALLIWLQFIRLWKQSVVPEWLIYEIINKFSEIVAAILILTKINCITSKENNKPSPPICQLTRRHNKRNTLCAQMNRRTLLALQSCVGDAERLEQNEKPTYTTAHGQLSWRRQQLHAPIIHNISFHRPRHTGDN